MSTDPGAGEGKPVRTRSSAKAKAAPGGPDRDMGAALRSVYQSMVDETVPGEMLDLLGKLD